MLFGNTEHFEHQLPMHITWGELAERDKLQ